MSYNVKTIEVFERQAKRLIRKYASLNNSEKDNLTDKELNELLQFIPE